MKSIQWAGALSIVLALGACATPVAWTPITGSRADATVTLGYQYGMFEQPQLSDTGDSLARQRCGTWGYTGAEAFGAEMTQCVNMTSSGCAVWQVTKTFQCTGTGTPGGSAYIDITDMVVRG